MYLQKTKRYYLESLANVEQLNVFLAHGRFLVPSRSGRPSMAPVAMLALCPGSLTLRAPWYRHTGRNWNCINGDFHILEKLGIFFLCFSPGNEKQSFSSFVQI